MRTLAIIGACALAACTLFFGMGTSEGGEKGPMVAHMVFFELKDSSRAAQDALVAACEKHLSGHDGTVYFSAGTIAEEFTREVNDRAFQVALHVVFKDKAAHDAYQKHARHLKFIEECQANWKKVRVFDSYVRPAGERTARPDSVPALIPLPDPAAGFAGMIRGKVVAKADEYTVVKVTAIAKEWEHNKAKDAKSMLDKCVMVAAGAEREANVLRFLALVAVGEEVDLDVAHKGGETLTLLELTEEQRARVAK